MAEAFSDSLFLPVMVLACLGWVVPKLLSMVMPEGVKPLIVLGILSAIIMCVLSAVLFLALYVSGGAELKRLFSEGFAAIAIFFGRLGVSAAIVWAPVMILSVASLPRHWVKETW